VNLQIFLLYCLVYCVLALLLAAVLLRIIEGPYATLRERYLERSKTDDEKYNNRSMRPKQGGSGKNLLVGNDTKPSWADDTNGRKAF
jgi:hypothetical protein